MTYAIFLNDETDFLRDENGEVARFPTLAAAQSYVLNMGRKLSVSAHVANSAHILFHPEQLPDSLDVH